MQVGRVCLQTETVIDHGISGGAVIDACVGCNDYSYHESNTILLTRVSVSPSFDVVQHPFK